MVVAVVLGVALLAAAAAWAAWQVLGNGNGAGRTGTLTSPTVGAGTAVADTFPSASATGTLALSITNPNTYALKVVSLTGNGQITVESPCDGALFTLPAQSGLNIAVPVGTSQVLIPDAIKLDASAPTTCMDKAITVPVSLTFEPA